MSLRVAVIVQDRDLCLRAVDAIGVEPAVSIFGFRSHAAARRSFRNAPPDVVIVDHRMPGASAICADLSASGSAVVFIAVPDESEVVVDALAAGARGVVFDTQPLTELPRVIRNVHLGDVWAPRRLVVAAWIKLRAAMDPRPISEGEPEIVSLLSQREREVLRHAAAGLGNKEVAVRLSISEATVKVHLTHIFQKLGLRGRGELAAAYFGHHPNVVRRLAN
jgi:DNA-binding NarL/FixJ family response regulator